MENSNDKKIKTNNKAIKILVTIVIILGLILGADILLKQANINGLEGYMYSLASDILSGTATSGNATSSNATSSNATRPNATSSNATRPNATSSNATSSNATCSNATSPNATASNVTITMTPEEIEQEVEKELYEDYQEEYYEEYEDYEEFYEENYEEYYNNKIEQLEKEAEEKEIVTFLEDNKIYIIIIGIALLTAIITGIILIVDKRTKKV